MAMLRLVADPDGRRRGDPGVDRAAMEAGRGDIAARWRRAVAIAGRAPVAKLPRGRSSGGRT